MRAAVLTQPGQAPAWAEHPDPSPVAGHTLVAVTAAPIVPLDQLCASGTSYFGRPATPYVPGVQGVGVVERSDSLPLGARVFFSTNAGMVPGDGSLAERCLVRDDDVMVIELDVADAPLAAVGMSGVAAWMCLTARAQLLPGERVLVLGGGGAVGQAAIGAARVLGAGRVVAVARSKEAQERARLAGADEVVPLTGDVDDLTARFQDAVGGSVDVVIDPVFGIAATAASRVLAPRGRLVNLGGSSGDVAEFSSAVLRSRTADVLGYTNAALTPADRRAALAAVVEHAAAGRLAVAHEVLPLSDVEGAWRRQAEGSAGVRLVLTP
ncbi:zinc-binding alcohol dehydrogenase family protein [Blastococcus sp. CT_GayMR20]|uniref:quinone oxidoreductase family protein n=1 Tax=Blastococcus sp. CT_GayMR20 TaxID=2559609 RepID=UPI001073A8CB|nr:zinc-binding dehydrogenase [Blastococcus sp. CT_GayMR20]TFV80797.1 zinc-binding alcohol dehydrogenase family protein [Blastococcus sp. CT_GayMR20]